MTRTLPWRGEDACFNAWPALRSVYHGDWLLRFGDGLSRRSNSVNPLRSEATLQVAELPLFLELYRAQDLPLIVRLPSLIDPSIDRELERLGFGAEGESCVLSGEIRDAAAMADPDAEVLPIASNEWLAAMARLQKHTPTHAATYARVIAMVALPCGFAAIRRDGEIVATAYGAIDGGLLCCESVVVSDRVRGQGFGRRLMRALLIFAARRGVASACLQVEAANAAGRALYRSIGLSTELHRYHYRRAPELLP